jgi:hypothetical protein
MNDKMCAFCYLYEIEFEGGGFLAVVNKPKPVMKRTKCKCKCENNSLTDFEGNAQCQKCEHFILNPNK